MIKSLLVASALFCACTFTSAFTTDDDGSEIILESFDNPRHKWEQMNDPVMGGKSTGTFTIQDGLGIFDGEVVDVPFLHAPGFIQARTKRGVHTFFPDVSSCTALQLELKSNEPYSGYRVSFGNAHAPGGKRFAFGYKADLDAPVAEFGKVVIKFDDFTDFWDDATGDAIHTCHENPVYCPDEFSLKDMKSLIVWAEGVAGKVHLEIKSISAIGCAPE
jgi:hypothetical protein